LPEGDAGPEFLNGIWADWFSQLVHVQGSSADPDPVLGAAAN
jgi:hypothetical protein